MTHHDAILVLSDQVRNLAHKLTNQVGKDLAGNVIANCDNIKAKLNAAETTYVDPPTSVDPSLAGSPEHPISVDDTPDTNPPLYTPYLGGGK